MGIQINGINNSGNFTQSGAVTVQEQIKPQNKSTETAVIPIETALDELSKITLAFNRRLKYKINEDLNEVVVMVIDQETNKVIKEIPSAEIQKLHMRIRETIGLLFDKTV